jgi:hypothetical protein
MTSQRWPASRWIMLSAGLVVGLTFGPCQASAQNPQAAASVQTSLVAPDADTLDRIHKAAAAPPAFWMLDNSVRFYATADAKQTTFADNARSWNLGVTLIAPPSAMHGFSGAAGGLDLLSLIHTVIQAHRERETRLIREQIERELRALRGE